MSVAAVIGATGQLGQEMTRVLPLHGWRVVALTRREVDVTDHEAVMRVVPQTGADLVVNCTAFTDVERAEDHAGEALAVNAFGVRSLARACQEMGACFVHYSTDFVFDGTASRPYTEDDRPNPQSVYAQSKLLGEWFATDVERHFVCRVESLFGGEAARSSVDRIIEALRAGRPARVFVDRAVSPSYVEDVAMATAALVRGGAAPGLYHVVNSGATTWHGVGEAVARLVGADPSLLEPVRVADVQLRASRPQYCVLSNAKAVAAGAVLPGWQQALERYLRRVHA